MFVLACLILCNPLNSHVWSNWDLQRANVALWIHFPCRTSPRSWIMASQQNGVVSAWSVNLSKNFGLISKKNLRCHHSIKSGLIVCSSTFWRSRVVCGTFLKLFLTHGCHREWSCGKHPQRDTFPKAFPISASGYWDSKLVNTTDCIVFFFQDAAAYWRKFHCSGVWCH